MRDVLDVVILNFNDNNLANIILIWYNSVINEVFGNCLIPYDCTAQEIKKLENKILSLSPSRQVYMIQHLFDLNIGVNQQL